MTPKEQELASLLDSISSKVKRKLTKSETLSRMQFRDLQIIDFIAGSKKTMGEVAAEFGLTPGTMTVVIDKLIEKEYIIRQKDQEDRRKIHLALSSEGLDAYNIHRKAKLDVARAMLDGIKGDESALMIDIMKRIDGNLKDD